MQRAASRFPSASHANVGADNVVEVVDVDGDHGSTHPVLSKPPQTSPAAQHVVE